MKPINFLYGTLIVILIASLAAYKVNACEYNQALDMDTNKCEDINLTIDTKLNAIVNGVWDGKKYVLKDDK